MDFLEIKKQRMLSGHSKTFYRYNSEKEFYSQEEKIKLYNDIFINQNLKTCLSTIFDYKWIPLEQLTYHNPQEDFEQNYYNVFDKFTYQYTKMELANNIIERGNYFPYVVQKINENQYQVNEGKHRFYCLKMAEQAGYISKDFSLFCLILKDPIEFNNNRQKDIQGNLILPSVMKTDKTKFEDLIFPVIINDFWDIWFYFYVAPTIYLSTLLFDNNFIEPNKYINNQNMFETEFILDILL